MKYADILNLTMEELSNWLSAMHVPLTGEENIHQLRGMVKTMVGDQDDAALVEAGERNDDIGVAESVSESRAENVVGRECEQEDRGPCEMAEIMRQMTLYTARKDLVKLKAKVAALEGNSLDCKPVVDVRDLEASLRKFSGDDNMSVDVWIRDLELAAVTHGLRNSQRWLLCNRMLEGSARSYVMFEKPATWKELCESLLKTFGFRMTNHQVAKQLQILANESLLQCFVAMRHIAEQGTFEETDIIKYIVDGLQDNSKCAAPLYYCASLDELREKMIRYQMVQPEKPEPTSSCTSAAGACKRTYTCRRRCCKRKVLQLPSDGALQQPVQKTEAPGGSLFSLFRDWTPISAVP
ncbi:uncharacterized protein LOC108115713 [Drosophila eugracilis]|uniref:uncharacterized protein LOC108115713 n=1 Tax=Drosophila eugracilis TaxID=29029 RepID=UPI001BDB449E|nr:uncharacterized protein LOC108115713 [Drosophila eugracilis]XP_041673810.1 uncharacterized protein LOC108115713 [Drosophila eugracilis]